MSEKERSMTWMKCFSIVLAVIGVVLVVAAVGTAEWVVGKPHCGGDSYAVTGLFRTKVKVCPDSSPNCRIVKCSDEDVAARLPSDYCGRYRPWIFTYTILSWAILVYSIVMLGKAWWGTDEEYLRACNVVLWLCVLTVIVLCSTNYFCYDVGEKNGSASELLVVGCISLTQARGMADADRYRKNQEREIMLIRRIIETAAS
eukprot:TRINITY_DN9079_c0_g2_i1.p1 TRINITY_DN9079_c0_g2~~TRINITY_DN9079_c0_g2_i1.p1  ORF type:complete len:201 (+),score=10.38 TRINITY_DN9079_c0_g2_i1:453-1055(+)